MLILLLLLLAFFLGLSDAYRQGAKGVRGV
jgi:hypothetical protein